MNITHKNEQIRVLVAQLGARMHYAVPLLLNKSGFLHQLYTDSYTGPGSWLSFIQKVPQFLKKGAIQRLSQRTVDLPADKITAYNLLGLQFYSSLRKESTCPTYLTDTYLKYYQMFLQRILKSGMVSGASSVYTFTGAGLELMQKAKHFGCINILEQMSVPIKIRSELLKDEYTKWGDWNHKGYIAFDTNVWVSREYEEWCLADVIIAPSLHVKQSLISVGVQESKITVIPYGVSAKASSSVTRSFDGSRPLRILFVGSVGIRKGILYLLYALKELGPRHIQAKMVGNIDFPIEQLKTFFDVTEFTGRVSRNDIDEFYKWADVFVLPSISEGSATVIYEAQASGLPVITTIESGAWIEDGIDGFIIPSRDIESIVLAISKFLEQPKLIGEMSNVALLNSQKNSLDNYQSRLISLINRVHEKDKNNLNEKFDV